MALEPRAILRVVDELLWALRREGFDISTAQAIDAARAVAAAGLDAPARVRAAIACVVVKRPAERPRFDAVFDGFFSPGGAAGRRTLWERLEARGFEAQEIEALREILDRVAVAGTEAGLAFEAAAGRGSELDRLLAHSETVRRLDAHSGAMLGYLTHRVAGEVGLVTARRALPTLRSALVDTLGTRGQALADALAEEIEKSDDLVRSFLRRTYEARVAELRALRTTGDASATPFVALSDAQVDEVRRAVRRFADKLRGAARVRARRARRGRIDPHRTLRRALRTGGVPCSVVRSHRRRDRPKVMVLCDVSDSVRAAAGFLLEFTYAAQELFERARSFVFVSDLREATQLFEREPVRLAIEHAWRGGIVRGENSNYGRVLRAFEARYLRDVDRSTTVVILGDGRTNYHDAAPAVLDRIRAQARTLLWLCPEPRGQWGSGDSVMAKYAPRCTAVYEVQSARDLERAARRLVSRAR